MKKLIILGAGTAGTMMANKLVRSLPEREWSITVLDQDNVHLYQPGLLFLPFGHYKAEDIVRPRKSFLAPGIHLNLDGIERVEPDSNRVLTKAGDTLEYDILIVASGSRIRPEQTEGLTGPGWMKNTFDFYTLEGSMNLQRALDEFKGGRVVMNVVEMPIKCPVAPHEFTFLADAFFTERGIRDRVDITFTTPLDGAFTKPRASQMLGGLFEQRGVKVESSFNASEVDTEKGVLKAYDGREIEYDLLVTVPLHNGADFVATSGMGDALAFIPTDKHTLQSKGWQNVFVLGDATDLPSSKAGAVAHFQAEVLTDNIMRYVAGRPLEAAFDGHANCFIETGYGKAMLIDFNYETEPLPGRFPLPGVGPFTLLEESHVNHWGKLGFRWVYWNLLLRGDELPIDHRMLMAGKWV